MIPVARLTLNPAFSAEWLQARYADLRNNLPAAFADADAWEAWYWNWNALRSAVAGEQSRRHCLECQDSADPVAAAASQAMREQLMPFARKADGELRQAFLKATCRLDLERRLGERLFVLLALEDATFHPANVDLQRDEAAVVNRYSHLMGMATVTIADETVTLVKALSLLTDHNASRRAQVWQAIGTWFASQGLAIHAFLDELVQLRQRQALNLGESNFVAVAYRQLGRTEYGPNDAARFREAIITHIVPLAAKLRALQARQLGLGTDAVRGCDMDYFPEETLGPDSVPVVTQVAAATTVFERLHPDIAKHWLRMLDEGLVDLANRPGKKPGAFSINLDDEDRAVIFCNSTGAQSDVTTLHHEMGHAVQAWESMGIRSLELRSPTMDAAEVHSFGLEYLALDHVEAYFAPDDAARFRRLRLMTTLVRVPYMACVDAFQHALYQQPDLTPAARETLWATLWSTFMPGLDFADDPAQIQYRWMRQAHIFHAPFYYIDYALAEVGALQLWQGARVNREEALQRYLTVCRLGGTCSLLGMLTLGGLRSPFDEGVVADIAHAIAAELGL